MVEQERSAPEPDQQYRPKRVFGQDEMFPEGEDLPLFSGTPQQVPDSPFIPTEITHRQQLLPGMPDIDYDYLYEKERARKSKRRGKRAPPAESGTLFAAGDPLEGTLHLKANTEQAEQLRAALAAYGVDGETLRRLAATRTELQQALRSGEAPEELKQLLTLFSSLLYPSAREQIRSPHDAAMLLMVEMGHLDQEQLRVLCLDTKNRLQKIHIVYQGSLNAAMIRVGEVYKEPLRLNSASIIVSHNHPSGDPSPSPVIWRILLGSLSTHTRQCQLAAVGTCHRRTSRTHSSLPLLGEEQRRSSYKYRRRCKHPSASLLPSRNHNSGSG